MPDQYVMQRDYIASVRLNLQHAMWLQHFGYSLHPSLAQTLDGKQDASIADIGTGTVIWALQLAEQYPGVSFTGFDISDAQYPHPSTLPSNVSLGIWDVHTEPPTEMHGKFDIVHMRALVSVVPEGHPSPVLNRCLKLLKPGGYVQWDEPDLNSVTLERRSDGPLEVMEQVASSFRVNIPSEWIDKLDDIFTTTGLENLAKERKRDKSWMLPMLNEHWLLSMNESAGFLAAHGDTEGAERRRQLAKAAFAEMKEGNYMAMTWQIITARKAQTDDS